MAKRRQKVEKFDTGTGQIKKMGRPSMYTPKDGGKRFQIVALTSSGTALFEDAREAVKRLHQWSGTVSDADTVEYLVRLWKRYEGGGVHGEAGEGGESGT